MRGWFQQVSAPAHTAEDSLPIISEVFVNRVISAGLFSPRSPDLTVCDFYLWGKVKKGLSNKSSHIGGIERKHYE